jgi:tetratricopeptide (TPR) repeat protein
VPADNPRILELRRRVQSDPASIGFAQLAEELRRAGSYDEAVTVCRAGLARHPGYLSARVTLGRTLIELGRLDDAARELGAVIESAPDNLAAIRGLAEINQLKGEMSGALSYYKRAMALAKHDPELEETIDRISQVVERPIAPAAPAPAAESADPDSVEALFSFDRLLAQLGVDQPTLPVVADPSEEPPSESEQVEDALSKVTVEPDPPPENVVQESKSASPSVEQEAGAAMPAAVTPEATSETDASQGDDDPALRDLKVWLAAINADRS